MNFINIILALLTVFVILVVMVKMFGSSGGTQPLTGAGPKPGIKPRQKLSNIRAARPRVRPANRRMRQGGTAMNLRRNEYATDILFLIALNAALDYDEIHYGLYDFVDSPFINDDIDYSGSDFEDYAEQDSPDRFDPPPPPPDRIFTEEQLPPEATSFEDLSSDDEDTRSSWGGGGTEDFGGSDYDSDSGGDWSDD